MFFRVTFHTKCLFARSAAPAEPLSLPPLGGTTHADKQLQLVQSWISWPTLTCPKISALQPRRTHQLTHISLMLPRLSAFIFSSALLWLVAVVTNRCDFRFSSPVSFGAAGSLTEVKDLVPPHFLWQKYRIKYSKYWWDGHLYLFKVFVN